MESPGMMHRQWPTRAFLGERRRVSIEMEAGVPHSTSSLFTERPCATSGSPVSGAREGMPLGAANELLEPRLTES